MNEQRAWIEPEDSLIPIQRQCELIGLSRASYDYQSQGESPENIRVMHLIDELFTEWPFYGYVLSWEVSISLETVFCLDALNHALRKAKPEIFNSDQGCQFTSKAFTDVLKSQAMKISMDGRGRCYDNMLIERLFRSVKYEKVYLNDWHEVKNARMG